MIVIIYIKSKTPTVLNKFNSFLLNKDLNLFILKNLFSFPTKKTVFTVLKSPHVNKTAQEKFESEVYSKKYTIYSTKPKLFIKFLKIVQASLFEDLFFTIQFVSCSRTNTVLSNLNPDKFLIEDNEVQAYIEMFNSYGEISLKQLLNNSLGSSVG